MSEKLIFKIYLWLFFYWSLPWLVMWRYKPGNFTTWKASPFVTFCPTIFALANTRGFIIFAVHICAIHWISIFFKMLRFSNKKSFNEISSLFRHFSKSTQIIWKTPVDASMVGSEKFWHFSKYSIRSFVHSYHGAFTVKILWEKRFKPMVFYWKSWPNLQLRLLSAYSHI